MMKLRARDHLAFQRSIVYKFAQIWCILTFHTTYHVHYFLYLDHDGVNGGKINSIWVIQKINNLSQFSNLYFIANNHTRHLNMLPPLSNGFKFIFLCFS